MKNRRSKKLLILLITIVVASGIIGVSNEAQAGVTNWAYSPGDSIGIIDSKLSSIDQQLAKSDAIIQNTQNSLDIIAKEQAWKQALLTDKLQLVQEKQKLDPTLVPDQNITDLQNQISNTKMALNAAKEKSRLAAAGECTFSWYSGVSDWGVCAKTWVSWIGALLLWAFTKILWVANELFNQAINVSVRIFSDYANMDAVKISWGVIRDLVNMGFIFVLLYIAIGTILELQGIDWRKLVPKLIIVALLVNFSAFFTRVIIDVSNVTANQFYLASSSSSSQELAAGKTPDVTTALMKGVAIFRTTLVPNNPQEFSGPTDANGRVVNPGGLDWSQIVTSFFGGIVLALVASFVFFAGAILFLIRTIRLLFLIILSPFAFFSIILPNTNKYWGSWLKTLANDATFAPAFLIMVYIVTQITQMLGTVKGTGSGWVGETISYMLIIGLLLGALIVAKALGAAGAGAAMKFASRANAFAVGTGMGVARLGGRFVGMGVSAADKVRFGKKDAEGNRKGSETLAFGKWAGKGISSTLKQVDKISPSVALTRRKITEGIGSPLKTGGDLLSRVTKEYGITGSILGSTKDEDRELRKREKEDKEAREADKIKQDQKEVEGLKIDTEDRRKFAQEKLQKIGGKTIVKIDSDSLIRLATLLTDQQMTNLEKELDSDKFAKIKTSREKPIADALGFNDKGKRDGTKPIDETGLVVALNKMSHQTVAKLPEEWLKLPEIIAKIVPEDIKEMRKAGVASGTVDHVTEAIKVIGPDHPAYDYVKKSPARGIPIIRGVGTSGPRSPGSSGRGEPSGTPPPTPDEYGSSVEE